MDRNTVIRLQFDSFATKKYTFLVAKSTKLWVTIFACHKNINLHFTWHFLHASEVDVVVIGKTAGKMEVRQKIEKVDPPMDSDISRNSGTAS